MTAPPATTRPSHPLNALVPLCAGLLFIAISAPLLARRLYAGFDNLEQYLPFRAVYQLALERGELGLWNPFMYRGYEHLGEGQTGILHPLHLVLYRCLELPAAFAVEQVIFFPLAFLGMYLLGRRVFGWSRLAASGGAVFFAFGTPFYRHFGHLHLALQLAHYPWLLYALDRVCRGPRRLGAAAAVGGLTASLLLLGQPQFTWLAGVAGGLFLLYRGYTEHWPAAWWRACGLALVGGLAGVLVGAAQLLPTLDVLAQSPRGELTALSRGNYSIHPLELLQNLSPFFYQRHVAGDLCYLSGDEAVYTRNPSEFAAYLGLGVLTLLWSGLVLYGARWRATERRRFLVGALAMAGLLVLLMLGRYGGLDALTGYVPLLSQIRCPGRYFVLLGLLAALAAAAVLEALNRKPPAAPPRLWLLALPALLSLLGCTLALALRQLRFRGQDIALGTPWLLLTGPLVALVVAAVVVAAARGRRWATPVLVVVCLADLAAYGLPLIYDVPFIPFAQAAALKANMARQDKTFRRAALDTMPLYEGYYLNNGYVGIKPREVLDFRDPQQRRLGSLAGAYLSPTDYRPFADPLPRFRLVPNLRHAAVPLAGLAGVDLEAEARCRPEVAPELTGPPLATAEQVTVTDEGFSHIVLNVTVHCPRLLVNSDRWTPDWHARVAGEPRPVLPLFDGAIRGVVIQPGDRSVVLSYEPVALRRGARLALAGGAVLVLMLVGSALGGRGPGGAARQCGSGGPSEGGSPRPHQHGTNETNAIDGTTPRGATPCQVGAVSVARCPEVPSAPSVPCVSGVAGQSPALAGRRWFAPLLLAGSLALVALLRLHTWHEALQPDECMYLLIAKDWIDGGQPYVTTWDNKPLGTFLLYRLGIHLVGYTESAPRVLALGATLLTTLFLWLLLRRHRPLVAALSLLVIWPALSCLVPAEANSANMEVFLVPLVVASCWLLDRYREHPHDAWLFGTVALLAVSLLLKQVTLPYLVAPLLASWWWGRHRPWGLAWRLAAMAALVALVHTILYAAGGYAPWFWLTQFSQNAHHLSRPGESGLWPFLRLVGQFPVDPAIRAIWPLTVLGAIGLGSAAVRARRGPPALLAGYWLLTLPAVYLPGRNPHYLILALPFILLSFAEFPQLLPRRAAIAPAFAILVIAWLGWLTWTTYLGRTPDEISDAKYAGWATGDRQLGRWLRQRGHTGQRAFVDGSRPGVLFYSGNRPAVRCFVAWLLPMSSFRAADVFAEMQARPPELLVLLRTEPMFEQFTPWLEARYRLVDGIEVNGVVRLRVYARTPAAASGP